MSSTHLRLEGPDLPSLLEQVRAEYGPGARIVHAERIRRGGIGGFFARERYHVEVEVTEVSDVRAAYRRWAASSSWLSRSTRSSTDRALDAPRPGDPAGCRPAGPAVTARTSLTSVTSTSTW